MVSNADTVVVMCGVDPVISKSSHEINEKKTPYSSMYTKKGTTNRLAIPQVSNYRTYIETVLKT